jgi:hypothetical protein
MCTRRWHPSPSLDLAETLRRLRDRIHEPSRIPPEDRPASPAPCGSETLPTIKLAVACGIDPFFIATATAKNRRVPPVA